MKTLSINKEVWVSPIISIKLDFRLKQLACLSQTQIASRMFLNEYHPRGFFRDVETNTMNN